MILNLVFLQLIGELAISHQALSNIVNKNGLMFEIKKKCIILRNFPKRQMPTNLKYHSFENPVSRDLEKDQLKFLKENEYIKFVMDTVAVNLQNGVTHITSLAELRLVTTVFISIPNLKFDEPESLKLAQESLKTVQRILRRNQGVLRQFLVVNITNIDILQQKIRSVFVML